MSSRSDLLAVLKEALFPGRGDAAPSAGLLVLLSMLNETRAPVVSPDVFAMLNVLHETLSGGGGTETLSSDMSALVAALDRAALKEAPTLSTSAGHSQAHVPAILLRERESKGLHAVGRTDAPRWSTAPAQEFHALTSPSTPGVRAPYVAPRVLSAELQDTSRSSTAKAAPSTSGEAQLPLEPKSKGLDTDESKSSTSSEAKWPLEAESKGLDADASGSSASSLGATGLGADVTTAAAGTADVVQTSRRRRKSSKC